MKLLIVTQKVDRDDPVLGFFHEWIVEFAKYCEGVTVIGLSVGTYELPNNVRVFSLGKEASSFFLDYIWNFYQLIIRERKNYDAVFVHMNPEYAILGGPIWKWMRKKIGLWYTHGAVNLRLRIATFFADLVFTASKESFRIETPKCHVLHHGIDIARFQGIKHISDGIFHVLSIGRLSRTKDYETLLDALPYLNNEAVPLKAELVGAPITPGDEAYTTDLKAEIFRRRLEKKIDLVGAVSHNRIEPYLARADIFVNMSRTGSLDKAVLEAMASGVPVVTSNEGLRTTLSGFEQPCMFKEGDTVGFAGRIRAFMHMGGEERSTLVGRLREIVEKSHNLKTLIPQILELY